MRLIGREQAEEQLLPDLTGNIPSTTKQLDLRTQGIPTHLYYFGPSYHHFNFRFNPFKSIDVFIRYFCISQLYWGSRDWFAHSRYLEVTIPISIDIDVQHSELETDLNIIKEENCEHTITIDTFHYLDCRKVREATPKVYCVTLPLHKSIPMTFRRINIFRKALAKRQERVTHLIKWTIISPCESIPNEG